MRLLRTHKPLHNELAEHSKIGQAQRFRITASFWTENEYTAENDFGKILRRNVGGMLKCAGKSYHKYFQNPTHKKLNPAVYYGSSRGLHVFKFLRLDLIFESQVETLNHPSD